MGKAIANPSVSVMHPSRRRWSASRTQASPTEIRPTEVRAMGRGCVSSSFRRVQSRAIARVPSICWGAGGNTTRVCDSTNLEVVGDERAQDGLQHRLRCARNLRRPEAPLLRCGAQDRQQGRKRDRMHRSTLADIDVSTMHPLPSELPDELPQLLGGRQDLTERRCHKPQAEAIATIVANVEDCDTNGEFLAVVRKSALMQGECGALLNHPDAPVTVVALAERKDTASTAHPPSRPLEQRRTPLRTCSAAEVAVATREIQSRIGFDDALLAGQVVSQDPLGAALRKAQDMMMRHL